jgi:hypothetical protein
MTRLPSNAMEGKQSPTLSRAHMKGEFVLRPIMEVLFVVKNSFYFIVIFCFLDYLCRYYNNPL